MRSRNPLTRQGYVVKQSALLRGTIAGSSFHTHALEHFARIAAAVAAATPGSYSEVEIPFD